MVDLDALLADLVSGDEERAEAAALALPGIGLDALTALQPLIHSRQADMRWWALRALAGWPPAEGVTHELLAALDDESSQVRQCAAIALASHPGPQALQRLIQALSDRDPLTASLAGNTLIQIGPTAVPALIGLLQSEPRRSIASGRRRAGGTLPGRHEAARLEAVRALAHIADPRSIPVLMKILGEDSTVMQYWAEQGLGRLGLGMIYIKPE
jgi:HEAT repeat protein